MKNTKETMMKSTMEHACLGLDVAKDKLDGALLLPNGQFHAKSVPNTPKGFLDLERWFKTSKVSTLHVCMEASGVYWEAVAEHLAQAGHTVSVINAFQIKSFAQACLVRAKTDRVDARRIARFCAERHPKPWQAPSPGEKILRALWKPRPDSIRDSASRAVACMPSRAYPRFVPNRLGKRFRLRLAAAGKPVKLIIGAMMRKLIHVAFGALKSGAPFDPALHVR
jgi:hypothetical protein